MRPFCSPCSPRSPSTYFVLLVSLASAAFLSAEEPDVDFGRDIQPLLSDRCFSCHGPDANDREADLRLDEAKSALAERDGAFVVKPGKPEESVLIARVTSNDEAEVMPPPDSGRKPLSAEEVALLRQWIEQGAEWKQHWSFVSPTRPVPPKVSPAAGTPIDAFVERRLNAIGLALSDEADKPTLIRRVTLDLTGLPPTLKEIDDFLADDSPKAYERVVDRLLKSPHYGERMAWPWLDAARYADTGGYQGDPERTMWPWRDWVVRSLNTNVPFDQFTVEQLAGDQLPNATVEQRLATGFNRNHMHNSEGGRIAEETRIENVFDRAETTGIVWLGMTLQCARCHDHKFDPTSNQDYFAFFDFFNQTNEAGRTDRSPAVPPAMDYIPRDAKESIEEAERNLAEARAKWLGPDPKFAAAEDEWESAWLKDWNAKSQGWRSLFVGDQGSLRSTGGATMLQRDDGAIHVTGKRPEKDDYEIVVRTTQQRLGAIRIDALIDPQSPAKGVGRDENGNFVLSELELAVVALPERSEGGGKPPAPHPVRFAKAKAEIEQGEYKAQTAIDGKLGGSNGWAVSGHTMKQPRWGIFALEEPLDSAGGFELRFRLRFQSKHTHHALALFRLSAHPETTLSPEGVRAEDESLAQAISRDPAERTEEEQMRIRERFRRGKPAFKMAYDRVQAAKKRLDEATARAKPVKVMVMDTRNSPRDTFVLIKGIYNDVTDQKVTANTPSMLPPLPTLDGEAESGANRYRRLDLARWIVSPQNPLPARVTVNRQWQLFFGKGIVTTPDDFGLQGERPTHPELLDWLAVEFLESDWDVKQLHKKIVMSRVYRQSAASTPERLAKDPTNKWLSRFPRRRMPSWMLRDQALAMSGLLNTQLGGPPVRPYQPVGVWAEATFGKKKYQVDSGGKLYRRSLYTFWRRIVGPTMFFDAAKRQTCEVKSNLTNTPLHALTTLNDVAYVEAARALAQRVMQANETPEKRIAMAFRIATARSPDQRELEILTTGLNSHLREFKGQPELAKRLLAVGASARDEKLDMAEHAAYAAVCNTILNLDETLVKP